MKAARIHEYAKPLVLEDIPVPDIQPDEVLVKVEACGMCRSDVLLIDKFFLNYGTLPMPIIPGHEIAGLIDKLGSQVHENLGLKEGDKVVVAPGWGDGVCRHCLEGNTQICPNVRWPGFGLWGGFAEYVPVPAKYVVKVDSKLKSEEIAPLTDAGLTPYRGIKKLLNGGALGADRVVGIFGIGGLGAYAVQYAKLLGGGAQVVAFARNKEKLAVAKRYGADHIIELGSKSTADVAKELKQATGESDLNAVLDCAGAHSTVDLAMSLLSISGHYVDVGFVGDRIDVPLFPRVSREQTIQGSFWGNNIDLGEVMALAARGKIQHTITTIKFDELNTYIDKLRANEVVGRAVLKF